MHTSAKTAKITVGKAEPGAGTHSYGGHKPSGDGEGFIGTGRTKGVGAHPKATEPVHHYGGHRPQGDPTK